MKTRFQTPKTWESVMRRMHNTVAQRQHQNLIKQANKATYAMSKYRADKGYQVMMKRNFVITQTWVSWAQSNEGLRKTLLASNRL